MSTTSVPTATFYQPMVRLTNNLISYKDVEATLWQLITMNISFTTYNYFDIRRLVQPMIHHPKAGKMSKDLLMKISLLEKKDAITTEVAENNRKRSHSQAQKDFRNRNVTVVTATRPVAPGARKQNVIPAKTVPTKKETDEERKARLDSLIENRQAMEMRKQVKENRIGSLLISPAHQEPVAKKFKCYRRF